MNIKPKEGILLIKKHQNTKLSADIAVEESDNDKALITGEVIEGKEYKPGTTVIFGKYSIFELVINSEKFYFIEADDIIGVCDYIEQYV